MKITLVLWWFINTCLLISHHEGIYFSAIKFYFVYFEIVIHLFNTLSIFLNRKLILCHVFCDY